MECPNCKETMIVLELEEVEIDYCISCKGIWLDSGELELLIDKEKKLNPKEIFKPIQLSTEKKKKCPRCRKKMNKVEVGDENKIVLDECKNEHGLWFDANELQSVINHMSKENKIIELLNNMFDYESNNETEER